MDVQLVFKYIEAGARDPSFRESSCERPPPDRESEQLFRARPCRYRVDSPRDQNGRLHCYHFLLWQNLVFWD